MKLFLVIFVNFFISSLQAADVCVEITAHFDIAAPDGVAKEIITLNGKFPGPTIRARIGDTLHIKFNNHLRNRNGTRYPTSVHFHGIEQVHTTWMDGPEQVTQCPIAYFKNMVYSTQLHQSGTYWYHSHHGWQYVDGFWGFLIVDNSPNEVYQYDDEILLSLMDWHWSSAEHLSENFKLPTTSPILGAGQPPIPNSTLINGRGNVNCRQVTGRDARLKCNQATSDHITVINVIRGFRYRVRVLNPSARAAYNFSIDGHQLQTIELDGVDVEGSRLVDVVTIWPAQRYSFLVEMNSPEEISWIRSEMVVDIADPNVIRNIIPLAALQYLSAPPSGFQPGHAAAGGGNQGRPPVPDLALGTNNTVPPPSPITDGGGGIPNTCTSYDKPTDNLDENQMSTSTKDFPVWTVPIPRQILSDQRDSVAVSRPDEDNEAPRNFDVEIVLNVQIGYVNTFFQTSVNGIMYNVENSTLPAIFRVRNGQTVPNQFVPFELPPKRDIQIVINNAVGEHPWHLHGHTFWVVGTGEANSGPYDAARDASRLNTFRLRRDTTHVHQNSWTVVRFHTDNPGVWLLHCHINWHLERGMGAVFIEGKDIFTNYTVPTEAFRVCREGGVEVS